MRNAHKAPLSQYEVVITSSHYRRKDWTGKRTELVYAHSAQQAADKARAMPQGDSDYSYRVSRVALICEDWK